MTTTTTIIINTTIFVTTTKATPATTSEDIPTTTKITHGSITPLGFVTQQLEIVTFLKNKSPYAHVAIYDALDDFVPFRNKYDKQEDQSEFISKCLEVSGEICTYFGIIPLCIDKNNVTTIEIIKKFIVDNKYIKHEEERRYYIDVLNKILNINTDNSILHILEHKDVPKLINYDSSHSDLILSIINNFSKCMLSKCFSPTDHYCDKFKYDKNGNIVDGPFTIMNREY